MSEEMIDPTEDEISFLQKLALRGGELTLQGNMSLLKIDRLIPDYVTLVNAGRETGVFTLTEIGLGACAEISDRMKRALRAGTSEGAIKRQFVLDVTP